MKILYFIFETFIVSKNKKNIHFQSNDPLAALANNTLAARIYQNHCLLKVIKEFS